MPGVTEVTIPKESKILEIDPARVYDVLVLGAGPAGLTAAVYTMRKGLDTAMLADNIGGQVVETSGIDNYMGYRHIQGTELIDKFFDQIKQFSISFKQGVKVTRLFKEGDVFKAGCSDGNTYCAKSVIVATGKSPRRLNVTGERGFTGRGVAYCVICDAPLYAGLNVAVVGGGNSAVESAIDLCKIAKHVDLVQFLPELTADKVLIKKLYEFNNFTAHFNCRLTEIKGDALVDKVIVMKNDTKDTFTLDVEGVFIAIGLSPNTSYISGFLELNEFDEITIDHDCNTSVKGVFAAGDVTSIAVKQIIVAAGEGAKAAIAAHHFLLGS